MKIRRLLLAALFTLVCLASSGVSRSGAINVAALPSVIATVNVGVNPRGIGIDEARNLIYVSNFQDTTGNGVSKIDGATLAVSSFTPAVTGPLGVAVDSTGNRVLVANNGQPVLSIIKGEDGSLISTPAVGQGSFGAAFNAATGKAYVASFDSNAVYRVNIADNNVKAIGLRGQPVWVALNPSLQRAYATVFDTQIVSVIDTSTDEQVGEFSGYFGHVAGIAVNPSNGDIFVVDAFEGAVTVVDKDGNFKGTLDVGKDAVPPGQARNVAINPNTGHVFVTRFDNNTVYVFDAGSVGGGAWASPIAQIEVGAGPEFGIAVNTTTNRVYVANSNDNTVSVISDLPKTIQLSTNSVAFATEPGGTLPPRSVVISDGSGGSLTWNIEVSYTKGLNWMTINPLNGTDTPATVTVGVNTASLADDIYTGRLTFSSAGAVNSPQTVDVTLLVDSDLKRVYIPAVFKTWAGGW